ncbi:hypothetical protein CE91St43_22620 [Oscillospiraceae bacterium]|nr:hypothetical protein CE91St43_22620 [Oscillospiraceae bacterium]
MAVSGRCVANVSVIGAGCSPGAAVFVPAGSWDCWAEGLFSVGVVPLQPQAIAARDKTRSRATILLPIFFIIASLMTLCPMGLYCQYSRRQEYNAIVIDAIIFILIFVY